MPNIETSEMLRLAVLTRIREWRAHNAAMNQMTEALCYVNTRVVQLEDIQTRSVGMALRRMYEINERYATVGNRLVLLTSPTLGCTDRGQFVQVSAFVVPDNQYR